MDTLDDCVVDFIMRDMPPPGEDVGLLEDVVGEAVRGLVERAGHDNGGVAEPRRHAIGDRAVHALRATLCNTLLDLFVAVLAPDDDTNRSGLLGHAGRSG